MISTKELQPLEIHFGDIFKYQNPGLYTPEITRIIVKLRDSRNCITNMILLPGTDAEYLTYQGLGTTGRKHIGKTIDNWDLERILAATQRGYATLSTDIDNDLMKKWWERDREWLTLESQKPPIILLP